MKKKCKCTEHAKKGPDAEYIGEAINIADDGKVTQELVKERTKAQNNNPRNND